MKPGEKVSAGVHKLYPISVQWGKGSVLEIRKLVLTVAIFFLGAWAIHDHAANRIRGSPVAARLAFYTIFCGSSDKIANQVQKPPSYRLPCYFFTDNNLTFHLAAQKGWIPVLLEGDPSHDDIQSNMKAKHIKTRPHHDPRLSQYRYTIYQDSKLSTSEDEVFVILNDLPDDAAIAIRLHNILSPPFSVWDEYNLAMTQERYQRQEKQMTGYIKNRLTRGYNETSQVHFWCSFIIRDMQAPIVRRIGEKWFDEIEKCGIDDQLSMFFTYQDFAEAFHPLSKHLLPNSQV